MIWVKCTLYIKKGLFLLGRYISFGDIHPKWYSLVLSLLKRLLNLCFFASLVCWGGGGGRERQQWRIWPPCHWRAVLWGQESAAPPPVSPSVPAAVPALPRGTDLWPSLTGLCPSQQNAGKIAPGTSLQQSSPFRPSSASSSSSSSFNTSRWKQNLAYGFLVLQKLRQGFGSFNVVTVLKAQPHEPCLQLGTLVGRLQFLVNGKIKVERPMICLRV